MKQLYGTYVTVPQSGMIPVPGTGTCSRSHEYRASSLLQYIGLRLPLMLGYQIGGCLALPDPDSCVICEGVDLCIISNGVGQAYRTQVAW